MSLFLVVGCDLPGRPNPAERPVPSDEVVDFTALYNDHCAGCHGADGKLGPAPPLNDPLFLAIVPDAELERVIKEGRAVTPDQRTPMPAFLRANGGPLTAPQVQALAQGIKKRWGPGEAKGKVPPYAAPEGKPGGDKQRGARVFARACAGCHGSEGQGGGVGAIHDLAFLSLISDQALRRYAITGRPDLGMPDFSSDDGRPPGYKDHPLTSEEITDLVALLAYWRQGGSLNGK